MLIFCSKSKMTPFFFLIDQITSGFNQPGNSHTIPRSYKLIRNTAVQHLYTHCTTEIIPNRLVN